MKKTKKLRLATETIRSLSIDALQGAFGGAINTTGPDCSQQTAVQTCLATCFHTCKGTNCDG